MPRGLRPRTPRYVASRARTAFVGALVLAMSYSTAFTEVGDRDRGAPSSSSRHRAVIARGRVTERVH